MIKTNEFFDIKTNKIKKIQTLINTNEYLCGDIVKPCPKEIFNYRKSCDCNISLKTKANLANLFNNYNIFWYDVYKYEILSKYQQINSTYLKPRTGIIIYGIVNNKKITYFRKETQSSSAGQTYVYFGKGTSIQATSLLIDENDPMYRQRKSQIDLFKKELDIHD